MILFPRDYLAETEISRHKQSSSEIHLSSEAYVVRVRVSQLVIGLNQRKSIFILSNRLNIQFHILLLPNSFSPMLVKLKDTNRNNFRSVPHSEYILIEQYFV